ncbi:LPS export ABC transporter permease LptG [Phenylobacterium sp.]|jgi:lipopolysaccharide export system permease protein|uniref:LPS export ABC transporter permease LptG n=1 Tax=Phenylobacterium sp. TaxID=1871053 RepID=UPI002F42ECCC
MRNRLERYVLYRNLTGVAGALAVITAVILLVQFIEVGRSFGVRTDVSAADVLGLTLLKSPSVIQILLPLVFLFGVMFAYVGLNRRSELVAMRAAGVSAWRFIMPSAIAAFVGGVIAIVAINPVAADMYARYETDRANIVANNLSDAPKDIWLRQGDDHNQMVIHAKSRDTVQGEVRLRGVSLFVYQKNAAGQPEFKRRLEADEALLRPGFWQLKNVREATAGESSVQSDSLTIRSTLDSEAAVERFAGSPDSITFWRLPGAIKQTEDSGFSASGYRLRFEQLLATPVMFAAMAILAAAFSLRLVRLGGLAGLVGAGVALGFVVFFFNQFSGALGKADIIPLFAAAWAPAVVALLSGLTLLCYTEDG